MEFVMTHLLKIHIRVLIHSLIEDTRKNKFDS